MKSAKNPISFRSGSVKLKTKYICDKCGNIKVEKSTWKTKLKNIGIILLFIYMCALTLTGTGSLIQLIRLGDLNFSSSLGSDEKNLILIHSNTYALSIEMYSKFVTDEDQEYFRSYVLNNTPKCEIEQNVTLCRIKDLYTHLYDYDYEVGFNLNARYLIKDGKGDCDEMSFLYITLLNSIDVDAHIQCSLDHCWTIINHDGKKFKADIIQGIWREKTNG